MPPKRKEGSGFSDAPPGFFGDEDDRSTDSGIDEAGANAQQLRTANMNTFGAPAGSRPAQRLHNTNKTGLGNGNAGAGWAFGAPSSAFGGLGGAPGLGQTRPGQLSGFAQVMGGGGGQGPIDMSDFPSLSGAPRAQQNTSSWNSNVIRQQPPQQQQAAPQPPAVLQQTQAQQPQRAPSVAPSHQSLEQSLDTSRAQQPSADRAGGSGDEFPPLSAQSNGEPLRQPNGFGSALTSLEDSQPQANGQHSQLPLRGGPSVFAAQPQAPIGTTQQPGIQPQAPSQAPESEKPTMGESKAWAEMTEQERYGLSGLQKMIEIQRAAETGASIDPTVPPSLRNAGLTMGQDLSNLDMDLDSPEPLYKTFHPFRDTSNRGTVFDMKSHQPNPDFNVPQAYFVNNVPPMSQRMSAFSEETLFAIFFQCCGDLKQELAAQELARRDWRWHKTLRMWLQQDTREANASTALPIIDQTGGLPIGTEPSRQADGKIEQGVYIFFDHMNWSRSRRLHNLIVNELDARGAWPQGLSILGLQHDTGAAQAALPRDPPLAFDRQNSIISAGADP